MSMFMSAHHRIRKKMAEQAKQQQAEQAALENSQAPDFEKMKSNELKEYAKSNGINISGLSTKEAIKARIIEVVNTDDNSNDKNKKDSDALPDEEKERVSEVVKEDNRSSLTEEGANNDGSNRGTA